MAQQEFFANQFGNQSEHVYEDQLNQQNSKKLKISESGENTNINYLDQSIDWPEVVLPYWQDQSYLTKIYKRDQDIFKKTSQNKQKFQPQFTVQNRETLDIDLQLPQEHSNSNAKKNGLKKYSNKDLLKYVAPIILLYIKGHTSNSKIKYCGNDKKRAQYYEQIIKISLSAEQYALVKQFQQKHRSTTIDQLKKLCGLKMLSEDLAEICDNSDNIRRLLLNQMRSPVFMKQMIKGKMSFNKKLSMIKKSSILERFPIEPQKISNFDQF